MQIETGARPSPANGVLMVVDDDEMVRESIALTLANRGFRVLEHASGKEALDALAGGERPDLILLDLMMPRMDGWEFRQRQLADSVLASIPVVAVSGVRAPPVDAAAFISKPLAADELLSTVEHVLGVRVRGRQSRGRHIGTGRDAESGPGHARPREGKRQRAFSSAVREEAQRNFELALASRAISHVVNNSLQGLMSYAQCVYDHDVDDADLQRAALQSARQCAAVLQRFADCTLKEPPDRPPPPLEPLEPATMEEWRGLCPALVEFRVSGLAMLTGVGVAIDSLNIMVRELITNAVEALAGKPGTVRVLVTHRRRHFNQLSTTLPVRNRRAGAWCCLDVIDDGEGIAPDVLPHIWSPFYSTKFAGRGLGLAEVLARMAELGGLVEAESVQGRGAVFRLLFPLSPGWQRAPAQLS